MKKRVLVYPCGTEIGLEIYKSLNKSTHYEIFGGSSTYDHGQFVYSNYIDGLPFITDESTDKEICRFNKIMMENNVDYIYPALDGVLTVFAKKRSLLKPILIAPSATTAEITRSKKRTYEVLSGIVPVPELYDINSDIETFPVFVKPDRGQGTVGALKIDCKRDLKRVLYKDDKMLVLEYLPGKEYTIDCFTNADGKLIYARARGRKRIKGGISVNAVFEEETIFEQYAEKINKTIRQKGGWFFQVKEDKNGTPKILEVASRIAGTSAIARVSGVNLPLLTVDLFNGVAIDSVIINSESQRLELDRALSNCFRWDLEYDKVYVDYDDIIIVDSRVNTQLLSFLYQCINKKKKIILLTKHNGDIIKELEEKRLKQVFDEIILLDRDACKADYIMPNGIFIDDSYNERRDVFEHHRIPVFDVHMIEGLLEERD